MSSAPPDRPVSTALARVTHDAPNIWEDVRLQKLWLATQRRDWRSLAVLGASAGVETLRITEILAHIAWCYRGQPSRVFDLRDLSLRLADYQLREVAAQVQGGVRVLIALRSIGENPTTIPVASQADAVVLCVGMGKSDFKTAEQTIAEVGRERVIGSILVRERKPTKTKA